MTTGMGRSRMRLRRKARPSMRGISTSSVSTSGFSGLIFSRATNGIRRRADHLDRRVAPAGFRVSSLRITAESSTTSTLDLLRSVPPWRAQNSSTEPDSTCALVGADCCSRSNIGPVEGRGESLDARLAGARAVVDLAREAVAEVLAAIAKPSVRRYSLDEGGVAGADVAWTC